MLPKHIAGEVHRNQKNECAVRCSIFRLIGEFCISSETDLTILNGVRSDLVNATPVVVHMVLEPRYSKGIIPKKIFCQNC